ncbi:hypothetical protein D3C76_898500 [compost metagenome]
MPDPHKLLIADLNAKIDQYFASGRNVHMVPSGTSGESLPRGMVAHHAKLRAERDRLAPTVKYLADQGKTVKEAAETMGSCAKRIRMIARENSITFGGRL